MYFKNLEATGFKSFVDNTSITFGKGVTAIVGPNGCGKSNISDAIRWVLGEQRPKLLRGAKMEDFIFAGSLSRKQAGMAEVSITMADVAGKLSRPELADYNEVTVTRRLYRSGESEYLINKTPCRLKDVTDLFLDTGISTRAFSIIEQEQVQKIVNSKPEDRRFIIEEAAGIMKYKNRRHQALNKLDGSQLNLERLSDIIGELERQKNSLKRQANKAERFKSFKAEMDELFMATSADDWNRLKSLDETITAELERLDTLKTSLEAEIATRRNELITEQSLLDEKARELSASKEEEFKLGSIVRNNEERVTLFASQISESFGQAERVADELKELSSRSESLKEDFVIQQEILSQKENEKNLSNEKLIRIKKEVAEVTKAISQIEESLSTKELFVVETTVALSGKGNELSSAKAKLEMLEVRLSKINEEKESLSILLTEIEEKREKKSNDISTSTNRFEELSQEACSIAEQINSIEESRAKKELELELLKTKLTENESRLNSLCELEESLEGYQEGIGSLLKLRNENHEISNSFKGLLLDKINVKKGYESAFEAVLGHRIEAILVEEPDDAIDAINLLNKDLLGRATFLSLNTKESSTLPDVSGMQGILGYAVDFIETDAELQPLIKNLLSSVVIVDSLKSVTDQPANSRLTFVTPTGDIIDQNGGISGGTSSKSGVGVLERRSAMDELGRKIDSDKKTATIIQNDLASLTSEISSLDIARNEKLQLIKTEEHLILNNKKDLENFNFEMERNEERTQIQRAELDSLLMDRDNLGEIISTSQSEIAGLTETKNQTAQEIAELELKNEEKRNESSSILEEANSIEVSIASINGEIRNTKTGIENIESTLNEITHRSIKMKDDIKSAEEKRFSLEEEIRRLKDEIHDALNQRQTVTDEMTSISEKLLESRAGIEQRESTLKENTNRLEMTKESLTDAKVSKSETVLKTEALLERLEENGKTSNDLTNFDSSQYDIDECREKFTELKSKLSSYGDVNLSAIEDYTQVLERLEFLSTQRDDLLESIENIRKVIDKLNRTTRQLFKEAFEQISSNFESVFKRLFNGGEAQMILTDETNILESGIEIMVRPPGKKRQSLTLLSAGERAMTALSVLFSVFMVMPSPFCLLDEVDAPLDEANIGRFKDILIDFSGQTQFLVITHNQKTMAFADRLYGITMQSPGVSQVLSVDMVETNRVPPEEMVG